MNSRRRILYGTPQQALQVTAARVSAGGALPQDDAVSVVEPVSDRVQPGLVIAVEVAGLGQVLAQQPVGVTYDIGSGELQ